MGWSGVGGWESEGGSVGRSVGGREGYNNFPKKVHFLYTNIPKKAIFRGKIKKIAPQNPGSAPPRGSGPLCRPADPRRPCYTKDCRKTDYFSQIPQSSHTRPYARSQKPQLTLGHRVNTLLVHMWPGRRPFQRTTATGGAIGE